MKAFYDKVAVAICVVLGATQITVAHETLYMWETVYVGEVVPAVAGKPAVHPQLCGIAVDGSENLYVAESKGTIARISPHGIRTIVAGHEFSGGSTDGIGDAARFNDPQGIAVDHNGNLFVTDMHNNTIRKITRGGEVTTLAGVAGNSGRNDGKGDKARFFWPGGIALNADGNIFVGDVGNQAIRKVTPEGVVTTLTLQRPAGTGKAGGNNNDSLFNKPGGVAVNKDGDVLFVGHQYHVILSVTAGGIVAVVGGVNEPSGLIDGPLNSARFIAPLGIAIDGEGNVFMVDSLTIRKISADGTVRTIGGVPGSVGRQDGVGSAARFISPRGIAVSVKGVVYVTAGDRLIRGTPLPY